MMVEEPTEEGQMGVGQERIGTGAGGIECEGERGEHPIEGWMSDDGGCEFEGLMVDHPPPVEQSSVCSHEERRRLHKIAFNKHGFSPVIHCDADGPVKPLVFAMPPVHVVSVGGKNTWKLGIKGQVAWIFPGMASVRTGEGGEGG
jgi:hypothetical protein